MKTVEGVLYVLPHTGWAEVYRKNEQGKAEVHSAWLTRGVLLEALRHTRHDCEVDLDDSAEGTRTFQGKPYYRLVALRSETAPEAEQEFFAKIYEEWEGRDGPICLRSYCDNPAADRLGLCTECATPAQEK